MAEKEEGREDLMIEGERNKRRSLALNAEFRLPLNGLEPSECSCAAALQKTQCPPALVVIKGRRLRKQRLDASQRAPCRDTSIRLLFKKDKTKSPCGTDFQDRLSLTRKSSDVLFVCVHHSTASAAAVVDRDARTRQQVC